MKNVLKKVVILSCIFFAFSCSKDEEDKKIFEVENFLTGYLTVSGYSIITTLLGNQASELGIFFVPLVDGKITSIEVKLPIANPQLRVTLWDKNQASILKTMIVNVAQEGMLSTIPIEPIILEKNKEYVLSINTTNWYVHRLPNGSEAQYPITVKNIKITAYKFTDGTVQNLPTTINSNVYEGDCNFNFQQTE